MSAPKQSEGGDRRISCAVLGMPLCVYLYCIFLDIRFEHLVEFFLKTVEGPETE